MLSLVSYCLEKQFDPPQNLWLTVTISLKLAKRSSICKLTDPSLPHDVTFNENISPTLPTFHKRACLDLEKAALISEQDLWPSAGDRRWLGRPPDGRTLWWTAGQRLDRTFPTAPYGPWARDTAGSLCHASLLSEREQTRLMQDYHMLY